MMNITEEKLFLALLPAIYERKYDKRLTGYELADITMIHVRDIMTYFNKLSKSEMGLLQENSSPDVWGEDED